MKSKQNRPRGGAERHTHFIGLTLPEELAETIEDCRSWMEGRYGCRSGHGTPPHITLVAPFALPPDYGENDVAGCCMTALMSCSAEGIWPLEVCVDGFGSFLERTLFAHVQDSDGWQVAYRQFVHPFGAAMPSLLKKTGRRFYPHISIANRDIPAGAMDEALGHFSQLGLQYSFRADTVAIFTRTREGGWTVGREIDWQPTLVPAN